MTSFQAFAELCQQVEGISSTLEKVGAVAAFLAQLEDNELAISSNFVMGMVFPPGSDLVMGVGPSILYEAITRACGCSAEYVSDLLRQTGDPGLVASKVVEKRRPQNFASFIGSDAISISDVHQ